jgi:peptide/nickel transport system permease protein
MSTGAISSGRLARLPRRRLINPYGAAANFARAVRSNRKATAGLVLLLVFVFLALFPGLIARDNPSAQLYGSELAPSSAHLLGTTQLGQDIFSQLIWSARASLILALSAGLLTTLLAVVVGLTAAYVGGIVDNMLSMVTDVFLVIPAFPLVVVITAYSKSANSWVLIAVLVVTGWSYGARQLRVQGLAIRERDFLVAARLRGERTWRVVASEILPTMSSLIVAIFLGSVIYAIITAAGLQFIGLGLSSTWTWGTMLYWAQSNGALQTGQPLWAIMPGVCIALLGASFALLNYAFDEVNNPALRPVRRKRAAARS